MSKHISRAEYCAIYGPTKGDRIALGDTGLILEIEEDLCAGSYGNECVSGGGKCARDGMGLTPGVTPEEGALDVVLTNMILFDPYYGVIKGDLGIRHGRIVGIGKAGNPHTMDITPGLVVSAATEIISGYGGMIATPGGVDCHIHFQSPDQAWESLANGVTTMIGGGSGAKTLSVETTLSGLAHMIRAHSGLPVNGGFLARGASSDPAVIEAALRAGAMGVKLHEDWGCTPATIAASFAAVEKYDCQIQIHTDTLNEAGNLPDTLAAFAGRTIHAYHVEGAGGGHAPDVLELCSYPNILPSSTNPTNPHTINTIPEHLDMILTVHHLDRGRPEDVAFAKSRIRETTVAAEDLLQDMGAISIMSADSQGMGRAGETVLRTWQLAAKMKAQRGPLPEDKPGCDNQRALRYLAKYTCNPAIALGISRHVGSFRPGSLADIVLWKKEFFGAKPEFILKDGFLVMSAVGDPNASTKAAEPLLYRRQYGALGRAAAHLSHIFVTQAALDEGLEDTLGEPAGRLLAVSGTRRLGKQDMHRNTALPKVAVDKQSYAVTIDGELVIPQPWAEVPLGQRYFFR